VAKEGLAIGEVAERQWWKDGVSPSDQVTGIGIGVTEADDGGETALAAGVARAKAWEDEEDKDCCVKCSHSGLSVYLDARLLGV
jgi:hypothetical protein